MLTAISIVSAALLVYQLPDPDTRQPTAVLLFAQTVVAALTLMTAR